MMHHHLDMIFSTRLCVEDQNLVEIKRSLGKIVKLDDTRKGNVGIIHPEV